MRMAVPREREERERREREEREKRERQRESVRERERIIEARGRKRVDRSRIPVTRLKDKIRAAMPGKRCGCG